MPIDEDQNIKKRAPRNRTLEIQAAELKAFREKLLSVEDLKSESFLDRTILGNCFEAFDALPKATVDLLILDPPYNLNKKFGASTFSRMPVAEYTNWLRQLDAMPLQVLALSKMIYFRQQENLQRHCVELA